MITPRPLRAWHLALWLVAAIASTMCGIGGGLFAVPILHFLLGLPLRVATSTSLVAVLAMTLTGTVAELFQPRSAIQWPVVGLLSIGGTLGAFAGQRVARRIDTKVLTWIFAVALCAAGARVLSTSGASALPVPPSPLDIHLELGVAITLIGFAGGFVAPLLGVGGGLIVVPALHLGVAGVSYLAARACSTAMSVVNSAQLSWWNIRERQVERRMLVPFAAVAALGAVIGILLVHRPGWAEAARLTLGILLVAVGVKFAWIGWRAARAR